MMPSGDRRYGVQVGNETYSLVVTQEDWEKRKLDRERERKLTLETNRRRKALEDKKKLANERESRKRELELAKRRQRQIEATERYQRSHSGSRDRQNYIIGAVQNTPTIEAVLQQLRSGDADAVYNTSAEPDYVGSARSVETGKYKFETELEEQKNKILENHRKKTMQEFSEQLHSNGEHQSRSIPKPSAALHVTQGDAPRSQGITKNHGSTHDWVANNSISRQPPPSYSYSNVDIMSGRTYASFTPMSPWPNKKSATDLSGTVRNDMPNPSAEPKTLAESLSRLFVGQQTPTHAEPGDEHAEQSNSNGLKLEEADEVIQDSLDYSSAKKIIQPNEHGNTDSTANGSLSKEYNANDYAHNMYYEHEDGAAYDDQDSLHGSTSSGTSPRPGSYVSTPNNNDPVVVGHAAVTTAPTEGNGRVTLGSQLFRSREAGLPNKFSFIPADQQDTVTTDTKSAPTQDSQSAAAVPHIAANPTVRNEQHSPNEGLKTPISYYIKAYRPWSASMSGKQPPQSHNTASTIRPGSEDLPKRSTSADGRYIRAQTKTSHTNFRPVEQPTEMAKSDSPVEPQNKWAVNVPAKTTATPISAMYSVPWTADNSPNINSRSVVLLARQAIPESPAVKSSASSEKNNAAIATMSESASPSPQISETSLQNGDVRPETDPSRPVLLKGILRRGSKYDRPASATGTHLTSYPAYQSAGVARQKWVNGINVGPSHGSRLKGAEVRDSLEVARKSISTAESEPKSVRWHQVEYNDGTTSALDDLGDAGQKMPPPPPAPVMVPQKLSAARATAVKTPKAPRPPSAAKGKPAPPRSGKAAKGKNGRGRKLKPAKEVPTEIEPHPPEKKTKQLSMSTVVNYSIDGEESGYEAKDSKADENNNKAPPSPSIVSKPPVSPMRNKIMFHQRGRVAWEAPDSEEAVTLDTLKSAGNRPQRNGDFAGGNVVVNQSNQVTIHVVSPDKAVPSKDHFKGTHNHSPISLNRTPTDQEINWLWDKVRACLSHNKASNGSPMLRKSTSDTGRQNIYARKGAWNAVQSTSGAQQTSANIISIDGGVLGGHDRNGIGVSPRVKGKRGGRRLMRPSSAIMMQSSIQRQATDAYNTYIQRHGLLQRRQRQLRGQRADGVKSATYPSPRASMYPPTPPVSADYQGGVSDSMTTFLLAETLAEQNIPEEQILHALESLQRKTKEAQRMGRQMLPSSLSMEEQKLLASLERLNTRLQEVQATNPYANHSLVPSQTAWTDYSHVPDNVPLPYSSSRGRTASADSLYRTSRIRY